MMKIFSFHNKTLKKLNSFSSIKPKATVTAPIFYLNSDPHIGHLYTLLLSDCVSRWLRFNNYDVIFTNGTDEHGQKVQKAAPINTIEFCRKNSEKFRILSQKFSVSNTHFLRTSQENHKKTVAKVWQKLEQNNLIQTRNYEGYYCVNEESFITEKDLIKSDKKITTITGHPVEWTTEKTHVYDFSPFFLQINEYLSSKKPIIPHHFNESMKKESSEIKDLSISRPTTRVPWAIPVPGNPEFTIYVWLDALCNYLTALDYGNENSKNTAYYENFTHIIGKDIVKFHGLYWPAFLKGLGLPLPKRIFVHDHWIYKGKKMSKSFGNVIDPFKILNLYGEEAVRIYFLSEGPEYYDSEYDEKALKKKFNEFIEGLVNAINRVFQQKIIKNGEIPSLNLEFSPQELSMIEIFDASTKEFQNLMETIQIRKSYLILQEKCDFINKYIGKTEVWKIQDEKIKNKTIFIILEMVRITSLLLGSFVPSFSKDVLDALKIEEKHRNIENVLFRKFEKNGKNENFHHEKNENFFLKVNLDEKAKFFRKKIGK